MQLRRTEYTRRAWQQGELDYMCGLYAIINAVKHCCDDGLLSNEQIRGLVEHPLTYLDKMGLLLSTLTTGSDLSDIREMLTETALGVSALGHYELIWRRPFTRSRKRQSKSAYLRAMAEHLRHPRTTIIILLDRGNQPHWTCVSRITARSLVLRDSTAWPHVQLADLHFKPRKTTGLPLAIQPSSVFFLRLLSLDDA